MDIVGVVVVVVVVIQPVVLFYETEKEIGMKKFECYTIACFVGSMTVNIQGM